MSGTSIEEPQGHAITPNDGWAGERWAGASRARDRKFWIGLAVAVLVHALLLIRIGTSAPPSMGTAGGSEDTISIDLVTQADLDSTATVAEQKAGDPDVPVTAAQPEQPPPAAPSPPEPQAEAPQPEAPPETKPEQQQSILPDVADNVPDVLSEPLPGEAPKKSEAAAKPKPPNKLQEKQQEKRTAKLDLSPPKSAPNAPSGGGGGSAGFERPPNITRSGENDAFGQRVIAALQKSMPPHSGIYGRLTVRIVLKPDGNVDEVKVIKTSTISVLDEVVLFAARQTPYPFPAPNSKDVDRVFLVTYIYR